MKFSLKVLFSALLAALAVSPGRAQQQPVVAVEITGINVGGSVQSGTNVISGGSYVPLAWSGGTTFQPANEAYGVYGTPINIVAFATGTFLEGSFTYSFFVNGISIGTTAAPVRPPVRPVVQWTPPQPGTYFITVTASDGINTATSLAVRYFATGTVVNSPVTNTIVPTGSSIVLKADATVAEGFIEQIQFYDNGVPIGSPDRTIPYSLIYTPAAGVGHSITAQARDNQGNLLTMSPPITLQVVPAITPLPTSVISSPAHQSAVPIPTEDDVDIPIAVDAGSSSGLISKVELYIDGVLFGTKTTYPYTFDWHPTVIGTYNLVALTYDDKNNVVASTTSLSPTDTPAPTRVTVASPPTVTLTSPTNGSTVTGGSSVTLVANASDSNTVDGVPVTITLVQFFKNGTFIGSDSTPTNGTTYSIAFTPLREVDNEGNVIPTVITALATNSIGLSTTSAEVTLNVTEGGTPPPPPVIGNPPTITLTSPLSGSQVPVNTAVVLTANAADTDGIVTGVQFRVNGTEISTDNAYPYAASWTPANLGTYTLTAIVTDNDGNNVTSTAVDVQVIDASPNAPTVQVTFPSAGASLTAGVPLTIQASATDDVAVASVQFFVNGVSLGTDTLQPFAQPWTPNSSGSYTIIARATDNVGTQTASAPVTVTVSGGSAPSVSLTSPTTNITISAGNIVNLAATAADADGTVASVRFLANGIPVASATSSPYLGTWKPTAAGTYTLVAEATDNAGNISTSASRTVTVTGNNTPSAAITSPTAGTSLSVGSATTISASASDPDGTITSVTFYANNVSIATDSTPPYSTNWTPNAEGTYSLTAVAIDNSGNVVTSPAILVLAGTSGSLSIDTVASGIYIGGANTGSFTAINIGNTSVAFIGYVPATQTLTPAKTIFFSDVPIVGAGKFELADGSGAVVLSGQFNDSGVTGTFVEGGTTYTFTGPKTFAQSGASVRTGYYNGSLTGQLGSVLTGIVGLDGQITIYAKDGSLVDSGSGGIGSNGAFSITTRAGNKFTGTADLTTGFLTGTLTKANGGGSVTFTGAQASGGTFSDGALFGLSTRMFVGTGGNILISGFAVDGSVPKRVLIRGVGPSMGIANTLPNPELRLYSGQTVIASNDNWGTPVNGGASATEISAAISQAGLGALGASEAAIVTTLNPGIYTTQLSGVGGATGTGLLEIYDLVALTPFTAQKMVAISSRGYVGAAGSEMIAGFIVTGTFPKKILIQAVGPGLPGVSGVLSDPVLRLVNLKNGALVRENDNWDVGNDATQLAGARARSGATPLAAGSKDAALLITLPPGIYTAVISGGSGSTGVTLVEVYEVR